MRSWFALTDHWTQFDPFFVQKQDSFKSSGIAVGRTFNE
jgi:damage-control phosphatase, subfamily III